MMPRLRVLRVIARLNVGGPALHVSLLTSRLDRARFDSLLATGTPGEREGDLLALRPDIATALAGRLVTIGGLGRDVRPFADARALHSLWRLVGDFRPHVLHTHTAKAGALARIVAVGRSVPLVVHTFHGTVFGGHFRPPVARSIVLAERALGRVTDQVLAVSPAVARDLLRCRVAPGRVRVVALGLDLAPFAAVPPLPPSRPTPLVVSLVARLVPVKDVELFIDAARIARRRLPALEVRVVGDGPLRQQLERRAPDWALFLGNRADMPNVLSTTGAVALSSRSEGSPVALIEALAAGRPVAAVPVGGVVDLLAHRQGAVLVPDRSPSALAQGIVQALTDPSVAAGATTGRASVLEEFGADRLVADIDRLYQQLWEDHDKAF